MRICFLLELLKQSLFFFRARSLLPDVSSGSEATISFVAAKRSFAFAELRSLPDDELLSCATAGRCCYKPRPFGQSFVFDILTHMPSSKRAGQIHNPTSIIHNSTSIIQSAKRQIENPSSKIQHF